MERLLQHTSPEPRFWRISVHAERITITAGPLHTPGTTRHIDCKSPQAALQTAEALLAQRLKDGFHAVDASAPAQAMAHAEEQALLEDRAEGWSVFADGLLEGPERLRGELVSLQLRAARKERGAVGQAKAFLKEHFDELVGAELASFHRQVFLDWRFGYVRAARVWSSPHSPPISEALPAVLSSPACRFLQRLEFGSPGVEGRYDAVLRTLAKEPWPAHLDSLVLGNFDVDAARVMDSAWPRLESLGALTPVAARLRVLDVRAVLNTFGRGLGFPALEALVLRPTALDARLLSDLQTLAAPKLKRLGLASQAAPRGGWGGWAQLVRQWLLLGPLCELELSEQEDGLGLLEELGDSRRRLQRVELVGLRAAQRLLALAPDLAQATLAIGDDEALAGRLSPKFPKLDTSVTKKRKPDAMPARRPARRYAASSE